MTARHRHSLREPGVGMKRQMSRTQLVEGLFSSADPNWRTPEELYRELDAEFHFDHDPCPPDYTVDGLFSDWGERNYVNPPYGRGLSRWLAKGVEQSRKGRLCVFLIPSRTDAAWWHDYVMQADEIRFVRGRLRFGGSDVNAPFPSAVVVFRGRG